MNINKSIFGYFIMVLFLFSCGNKTNGSNTESNSATIELNNGEKWVVNAEMTPFILDGEQLLSQYDGNEYASLAAQLKQKNTSLIKSCTMDGKSHDELHKWLHPHLEMVDALSAAKSKEDADKIIVQLSESYKIYNQYFQ